MDVNRWDGHLKVEVLRGGRAILYKCFNGVWSQSDHRFYSKQDAITRADELFQDLKGNEVIEVIK